MGKTVDEILTGKSGPMSNREFLYWTVFWGVKNKMQEDANKKAKGAKAPESPPEFKKTMGRQT